MGTNFYLKLKGRSGNLHIGKSSFGWTFGLHCYDGFVESFKQWKELWNMPGSRIVDEYGKRISVEEMEDIITKRGKRSPTGAFGVGEVQPGRDVGGIYDKRINLYRHEGRPQYGYIVHNKYGKTYDYVMSYNRDNCW